VKHELWCLTVEKTNHLISLFVDIESTYIADGHHRSASSARLHHLKGANKKNSPTAYFLSFLVQENQVEILAYNRLVKTLNSMSVTEFCFKLKQVGELKPLTKLTNPSKEHELVLVLKNEAYTFTPFKHLIDKNHPVNALDAEILTQLVLKPILGIEDLKTSDQIVFSPGNEPIETVANKIYCGKYELGFFLYPATIQQVKKVADHRMNMPPKSTWVEPKLRSGLTIYPID
jgi:uncharacterized protein (DUF1015 family)